MEAQISAMIKAEAERMMKEQIGKILEDISKECDIRMSRLMTIVSRNSSPDKSNMCCGITKAGTRCTRASKDGFCKTHESQRAKVVPRHMKVVTEKIKHTHTLPPLFLAGCPACENATLRNCRSILPNE
jgi:hypothetical protein